MNKETLKILSVAFLACAATSPPPVLANGDTSADVSGGFADVLNRTHAVVLRVPINDKGEENTNAAEIRFDHSNEAVTRATNPETVWSRAVNPGRAAEVLGTNAPAGDSSTWGWYNWYNIGWAYPYYYSYYYPTFYWNSYYYYYAYGWYWNWYDYRYYYYYSWY